MRCLARVTPSWRDLALARSETGRFTCLQLSAVRERAREGARRPSLEVVSLPETERSGRESSASTGVQTLQGAHTDAPNSRTALKRGRRALALRHRASLEATADTASAATAPGDGAGPGDWEWAAPSARADRPRGEPGALRPRPDRRPRWDCTSAPTRVFLALLGRTPRGQGVCGLSGFVPAVPVTKCCLQDPAVGWGRLGAVKARSRSRGTETGRQDGDSLRRGPRDAAWVPQRFTGAALAERPDREVLSGGAPRTAAASRRRSSSDPTGTSRTRHAGTRAGARSRARSRTRPAR
ncbi:uncharacterized protein LOC123951975 [Meles meles]|uniref:uncharacterized protein LOC123951975 n=1 Tax=Meles meles TaxID=9662 RepID=UPI001E698EBD|nr:uncharacterized protein LOC123951975 [Meles meles]